ncbi:DUF1360 domain-containing protein [Paenibacillus sp. 2RAB27]|uniref:DUF1360 domain-containing protein n=1 Tax=Paenibacillus sp. 2RAB27 TaxID=3232991 RepID=UPI003F9606AB
MNILTFIILSLAVFRITHLFVFDKITEPIRKRFVTRGFDGQNITFTLQGGNVRRLIGNIVNCYWCAGIWVSAIVIGGYLLSPTITFYISYIFALSSVQALIETKLLKSVGMPIEMKEVPAVLEEDEISGARGFVNALLMTLGALLIVLGIVLALMR